MGEHFKSNIDSWLSVSKLLYYGGDTVMIEMEKLYDAYDAAQEAIEKVNNAQESIGSLVLTTTLSEIEEVNEKRRILVSFCNGIHYEASELIDNPFSKASSDLIQKAYDLDPSDIEVKDGKKWLFFDKYSSLTDLISATMMDDDLKKDFLDKADKLDDDILPEKLTELTKEAYFWEQEYRKATICQEIAENIFTEQVRKDWDNMSEADRKKIIEEYVESIGTVLGDGENIITGITYDSNSLGEASPSTMAIKINPGFVKEPEGNYSVDKVIDTLTHEVRHVSQYDKRENPEKYDVPASIETDWKLPSAASNQDYSDYYKHPREEDAKAFAALSAPSW